MEYLAQFLDSQINAKNMRENKNKNNGLNIFQSCGYELEGPNPYEQMRNKLSKFEIYEDKNYWTTINSNTNFYREIESLFSLIYNESVENA